MDNQMIKLGNQELLTIEGGTSIPFETTTTCGLRRAEKLTKKVVDHFKNHRPSDSYANNSYMNSMTGRN